MAAVTTEVSPRDADEAIAQLYAAQWTSMVRLAWLLVHDQGMAEDIVADSLLAVHRKWDTLRLGGQAGGYLRQTVLNNARSALRHRKVVNRQVADDIASGRAHGATTVPSAEDVALRHDTHDAMVTALAGLSQRQREVLALRYYLDLSEADIARTLGISTGAVKAHAHRGLIALRDRVATTTDPREEER